MGCTACPKDFVITRSSDYAHFTLHIVYSGCSFLHVAGRDFLLKKGDAFIIAPGEGHTYRNAENSDLGFIWIEFCADNCKELLSYFGANGIHTIDSAYTEKIAERLADILFFVKNGGGGGPVRAVRAVLRPFHGDARGGAEGAGQKNAARYNRRAEVPRAQLHLAAENRRACGFAAYQPHLSRPGAQALSRHLAARDISRSKGWNTPASCCRARI
jgi:hypothetical protein